MPLTLRASCNIYKELREIKEILLSFVEDLLRNNNIPVHLISLPCEDYPGWTLACAPLF